MNATTFLTLNHIHCAPKNVVGFPFVFNTLRSASKLARPTETIACYTVPAPGRGNWTEMQRKYRVTLYIPTMDGNGRQLSWERQRKWIHGAWDLIGHTFGEYPEVDSSVGLHVIQRQTEKENEITVPAALHLVSIECDEDDYFQNQGRLFDFLEKMMQDLNLLKYTIILDWLNNDIDTD